MAYFANIDSNNIVTQVIFVDNENALDEQTGVKYCNSVIPGNWIQTSYNNRIRKNYAGIGYFYDAELDAFIPPKPFDSWTLDTESCVWICPIEKPLEGEWYWDEENLLWSQIA
jgi:hypothetical protein